MFYSSNTMSAGEHEHLHEDDTEAVVLIASAFSLSHSSWNVVNAAAGGNGRNGPTVLVTQAVITAWIVDNESIGLGTTGAGTETPIIGLVFVAPREGNNLAPVRVGTTLQAVSDASVQYRITTLFMGVGFIAGKVEPL
jgi:hypothetical protein